MAKLKAPLLSFSASGAIAKSLVFFSWKGLNVARQYTVPSNPNTLAQSTQRGLVTAAVAMVHAAEIVSPSPLIAFDQAAYALWGSIYATPRTWFNQFVKNYIDQHRLSLKGAIYRGFTLTPTATQVTVLGTFTKEGANDITAVNINYGTSKTNMINTLAATKAELAAGKAVTGLSGKTKYFFQIRPTAHADFIGTYSGIYFSTTL